jgi:hypothetical protein
MAVMYFPNLIFRDLIEFDLIGYARAADRILHLYDALCDRVQKRSLQKYLTSIKEEIFMSEIVK